MKIHARTVTKVDRGFGGVRMATRALLRSLTISLSGLAGRAFCAREHAIHCEDGAAAMTERPLERLVRPHATPQTRSNCHPDLRQRTIGCPSGLLAAETM